MRGSRRAVTCCGGVGALRGACGAGSREEHDEPGRGVRRGHAGDQLVHGAAAVAGRRGSRRARSRRRGSTRRRGAGRRDELERARPVRLLPGRPAVPVARTGRTRARARASTPAASPASPWRPTAPSSPAARAAACGSRPTPTHQQWTAAVRQARHDGDRHARASSRTRPAGLHGLRRHRRADDQPRLLRGRRRARLDRRGHHLARGSAATSCRARASSRSSPRRHQDAVRGHQQGPLPLPQRDRQRLDSAMSATPTPAPSPNAQVLNLMSDVAVRPGTGGKEIVAVRGWRAGAPTNGLYVSRDGGDTFKGRSPRRATCPRSRRAARRSPTRPTATRSTRWCRTPRRSTPARARRSSPASTRPSATSTARSTRSPARASSQAQRLGAEPRARSGASYKPGVQAWYNQFLVVDPNEPEAPLRRARGGLRDDRRRLQLGRRGAVLEPDADVLRPHAARLRRLPEHDALRPARGDGRRRHAVGRQRRRRVLAPDVANTAGGGWTDHNRPPGDAAVLLRRLRRGPGLAAAPCSGAACRTTAPRS